MAEDRTLPGMPKKRLVKRVRQHLRCYGIAPTGQGSTMRPQWEQSWAWADKVASSYLIQKRWPLPSEIAAQYVFLLLAEMHKMHALKLPYRAGKVVDVRQLLGLPPTASPLQLAFDDPTFTE